MKKILVSLLAATALPVAALAQDTTLAGWTFSQFIFDGYPSINTETGEPASQIVATYRGSIEPNSDLVDGQITLQNPGPGYSDPTIGSWSFASFDTVNEFDVRSDSFGALNTQNSTTLDGKLMHLTDQAGMMLTFNLTNTLWDIQVNDTGIYTNASVSDFTFAARGNGGDATVEWLFDGSVFATSAISAGNFLSYGYELPTEFYGDGVIQGRLVSGSVSFDNVQVNGAPIPEPSSFAALAGLAGLGFAASRRRRA